MIYLVSVLLTVYIPFAAVPSRIVEADLQPAVNWNSFIEEPQSESIYIPFVAQPQPTAIGDAPEAIELDGAVNWNSGADRITGAVNWNK